MDTWIDWFNRGQQALFEALVQPLVFALGGGHLLETAYEATGWLLIGLLQVVVMLVVIRPLEARWPAEAVSDRAAIRVDILYTLIHRLGLFKLAMFFTVDAALDELLGWVRVHGWGSWHLDQALARLLPGWGDMPWVAFVSYLIVFDLLAYALHRGQHGWNRWWALHAVHHAQRQMTMWSDNRNHLLDDVAVDIAVATLAAIIGVPPGQFVALVATTQLMESFQHANVRLALPVWVERLLVTPRFHRVHHAIGIGHESAGPGSIGGCNFGVLLPWWDMMFRTADFHSDVGPTGIRDQVEPDARGQVRDYGRGFWRQQVLGVQRLFALHPG